ncbi:SH3 domain-containing protein [Streptomyces yaizuensis]|uniref:SH3 domain-containing protein n=1 Tax=Streptomyces yaizuensis TaxID=2989713 RepID=A0ABQ5NR06_9ACTN|nr:hypothetical protein [Streptomyces sp. YSPA8]GLF92775.1 SH3 domain-containing protein [Streptomyces sp. YSPA8]
MTRTRRAWGICAVITALVAGSTAASASAAPDSSLPQTPSVALGCTNHAHNNGDGAYGNSTVPELHLRSGPHSNCPIVGTVDRSSRLNWHCFTVNEVGNEWTFLGIHNTNIFGWVYNGNLTGSGSEVRCR